MKNLLYHLDAKKCQDLIRFMGNYPNLGQKLHKALNEKSHVMELTVAEVSLINDCFNSGFTIWDTYKLFDLDK